MKKYVPLLLALVISVGLTLMTSSTVRLFSSSADTLARAEIESALLSQEIIGTTTMTRDVYKLYERGQLIGVLNSPESIDRMLKRVYEDVYSVNFPDSTIGLNEDVFIVNEPSVYIYSDIDNDIVDYFESNDLFAVEVNRVEFSNGAVIFVRSLEDFEEARKQYLLNFISEEAYERIRNQQEAPALANYGYRELSFNVIENISVSKGLASQSDILKNINEIVYFLSYGYGTEIKTYKVEPYDTVAGVASKNGLSAQQVLSINSNVLRSETQVLEEGMELNVTYFNSPINVVVTRERLVSEPVYPQSTLYVPDNSLREGLSVVQTREELGSKDVIYTETYINGELVDGEVKSSIVKRQPVREVVRYGTRVVPGVGSGSFRWPVNNPRITCGWYCYAGHTAIDIVDRYNRFGTVYAADRGIVAERGYNRVAGYYVRINHNNGYQTQYNHFAGPAFFPVGVAVEKGEAIGRIGMSGITTGPHVHFVVIRNGVRINPCRVLNC
jgi:murein DD-endopeptidase MepM/ murein hydrolase activator NlpD